MVRAVPNLKPSWLTSALVSCERMSRARGPQSPIVVHEEVRSAIWAPVTEADLRTI